MKDRLEANSRQLSLKLYGGFFLFLMALALDDLRSAEIAATGRGWHLHLAVATPWILGLLVGMTLYLAPKRNQMSERTAGPLLMILAVAISNSYQAMYKLSTLAH